MANIGAMNRRVSIINLTPTKGSDGSWTPTTGTTVITCWAYRKKRSSDRSYNQFTSSFENIFDYEIYYNSTLTLNVNMIIRDASQDYTIQSIELVDDKKRKYKLTATLKASG